MNKFWKNRYLLSLYIFNGFFVLGSGLLGPLYAVYVQKIDNSVLAVSFSWAVFLFSTTIFLLLMTQYGDRIKNKKYLIMMGYLIQSLAWLGYIYIGKLWHLLGLQILLGLAEAIGAPTFQVLIAEHLDDGNKIKEYSVWKIILNATTALSAIIGGLIVNSYGFESLFYAMSFFGLISFVGLMVSLKD